MLRVCSSWLLLDRSARGFADSGADGASSSRCQLHRPALAASSIVAEFDPAQVPAQVHSGDEKALLVFADALEESGRTAESAWLRQENVLLSMTEPEGDELRATLRRLQVPDGFKASVAYVDVEGCEVAGCPSRCSELAVTERAEVRSCSKCSSEVHFASTLERAQTLTREATRVAVSPDVERSEGDLGRVPWPTFVSTHRRWSDAFETAMPCARSAPLLHLPEHPLFGAWHQEIMESPVDVALVVRDTEATWQPTPADSFAHGRVAFLEQPAWPSCSRCSRPLEMCLQLSASVMKDWLPGDRGLVVMFCFHCLGHDHEPGVAFVQSVRPLHRVTCEQVDSASSGWDEHSLRVTVGEPRRRIPDASWHRYRSEVTTTTAASLLLGWRAIAVDGPFPDGLRREDLEELSETWDEWSADAQGQAMINTDTALTRAKVKRGCGPQSPQTSAVSSATPMTAGTNHEETTSARR